jgi:hypothetical protein
MANNTSSTILNTSANLLGFCLIVITSLHVANKSENNYMDELTAVVALLLSFSCFFSFMAIRTQNPVLEKRLETIADYLFMISLTGILLIILLITLNLIN